MNWRRSGISRRRQSAIAAALVMSTCGLAACGGGGSSSSKTLTIQVGDGEAAQFAPYIKLFKQEHPGITVKTLSVSQTAKTGANLTALTSSNPPDVGYVPTNTEVFSRMTAAHELVPLNSVWTADNLYKEAPDGATGIDSVGGTPYVVSFDLAYYNIIYYNTGLFQKLHIAVPANHQLQSISQLVSMAKTLEKSGYGGVGIGPADGYQSSWLIDGFMDTSTTAAQYANYLSNWQKSVTVTSNYTSAPFVNAVAAAESLAKGGVFPTGYLAEHVAQSEAAFVQGHDGMLLDGEWSPATLKTDGIKFAYNWFVLPPVNNAATAVNKMSLYTGDAMGIPSKAPNKTLAKEFLETVMSVAGQTTNLATGELPANNAVPVSKYSQLGPIVDQEVAYTNKYGGQIGWTSGVPGGLGQQYTDPQVQSMFNGQTTPQEIGAKVQQELATFR